VNPVSPFAYAQARLQARLGARPSVAVWERLCAFGGLAAWLEQARATPLRHWLASVSAATPPHEIERLLRAHFRRVIAEVARWVPPRWRAAVRWLEIVPDLPALAHLLRGEAAHDWMREEPVLRAVAEAEPSLRARALARGPWADLAAGRPDEGGLFVRWVEGWHARRPDGRHEHALLAELTAALRAHRDAFPRLATTQTESARLALEARLVHIFRRSLLAPAAAFAWLLLAALEFERVRGELLVRALFSGERP
jgi:hypothetical protein